MNVNDMIDIALMRTKQYTYGIIDLSKNTIISKVIDSFDNSALGYSLLNELKHKTRFYLSNEFKSKIFNTEIIPAYIFYMNEFNLNFDNIKEIHLFYLSKQDFIESHKGVDYKGSQIETSNGIHYIFIQDRLEYISTLFHELTHVFDKITQDLTFEYLCIPYTIRYYEIKAFLLSEITLIKYLNTNDGMIDDLICKIKNNIEIYDFMIPLDRQHQSKLTKAKNTLNYCIDLYENLDL